MKAIYKKRELIQEDAIAFLRNGLYTVNNGSCPDYLRVMITAQDKAQEQEIYEEDIAIFKELFNFGNANYKIALWNRLTLLYDESTKFCKEDFSRDEFAFIKAALKASSNQIEQANINEPIETDRLILRPIEKSDFKLFAQHYKHDGDFAMFTGHRPTSKMIKNYAERRSPALFTIEEKNTYTVIGYIGLSIKQQSATGLLEYYIFKEHRKQGYCKEVVKALVNVTMAGKLYEPQETVRDCVYKKKTIKLNAIRARIATVNTPSIKTVESCGFIYEATIHKTMHKEGIGWMDEDIYYITKELNNGK